MTTTHIGTQEGGSWASVPLVRPGPKKEVLRFDEVVMGSVLWGVHNDGRRCFLDPQRFLEPA